MRETPSDRPTGRPGLIALAVLTLLVVPFAFYALDFGWRALTGDPGTESYLFTGRAPVSETGLSLHMLAGAAVTALVPLQLLPAIRRRWPAIHRWSGRFLVGAALIAAAGGLAFIAGRGTIGGRVMDAGFALYGVLLAAAAVETLRHARAGNLDRHRRWALRLAVLILGSWLFRVHYVLWYAATGGLGSTEDLTGPFDRVQVVAFYLPYLAVLEIRLRRLRRDAGPAPERLSPSRPDTTRPS